MSHSQHSLSSPPAQPHRHFTAPPAGWRRTIFALITIFSTALHLVVPLIGAGQSVVPAVADAVLGAPKKADAAALPDTSTGLTSNQFLTTVQPEENMVVNGSFEMGATAFNQTKIPGWTVVTGTVDLWSAYTRPDGSTNILELEGSTPGAISQTLTGLTPSATYYLEFEYGTQGSAGDQASIQVVNSSNATILNQTITSPNGDPNNLGWMPFRQTFVAPADGIATLRFTSLNTNSIANYGVNIDDVRVAKRLINYVQNGSFENGPVMVNATANAPAWTVTAGNIDVYNAYFRPDGSSRYLNVNGNTAGTISQTVSGLSGNQTYYLDFDYSSEGNISTQAIVRLTNSSATQIFSQTLTSPGDANNRGWQHFRTTFTAPTDGIATLQFAGITAGINGVAVDNVRIADEPLNWVVNGDFQSGPAALNIANNAIPGWTVGTGPADIYQPGLYYDKALDLRGSPGSVTISQTVSGLTAGQVYVFQANYASNGNLDRWGFMRLFDSGGTPLLDQRVACNNDITARGWCMLRYSFTAPADGIVRIQLADDTSVAGPNNLGINVDNVQISHDVNFIINGSFSSGPSGLNQPAVPGWSAVDTPDLVNAWNGAAFGNALDLKGSPGTSNVTQNLFGLTPGQSYTLRYNWAANSDAYSAQFNTQIVANSGTLISVTQSTGLNAAANNAGQRESRHVFTAPADGKVSIIFRDIPDPLNMYYGVIIDNVSVFGTASTAGVLMNVCLVTPPIKTPTASPGGVSGGLVTWVRADAGISASDGGPVSVWTDQSSAGYNFSQATSVNQPLYYSTTITKLVNFNPTLDFDGSNHYLRNRAQLMLSASPYTFLSVGVDDGADTAYRKLFGSEATVDKFGVYRQGGATNDNGWIPYAVGGQSFSAPFLGDRGSMGKGTKYSAVGGPNGFWNGTNFTSDNRTSRAQPQIVGFNSANSSITDRFYTWTDGYKDDPNWSPIRDGLGYRDEFFAQTAIGADINVELWKGRIPEFIAYSQSLTDTDIAKINSYLAVKYGITLGQGNGAVYSNTNNVNYVASDGTVIWNATANSAYNYNIAGVGRDDASTLLQKQSQSVNGTFQPAIGLGAIATTNASNTGAVGTDKSFMMWGSSGAAASFGTVYTPTSYTPPAGYYRMNRVWKVQETGAVGTVEVDGPSTANLMLVSTDPTFATGVTEVALTSNKGNYNFVDGQYFTFGAEATAPGGVNNNLLAWVKADAGTSTTTDGAAVNTWADQTQTHYDFTQATGAYQPLYYGTTSAKLVNYNPTLEFDGIDDHLRNTTVLMPSSSPYTFLSVGIDDGTDTVYRNLFSSEAIVDYFALYRNGGAPGDNGWVPYAIGGQSRSAPLLGDRGSMGKGTKYSASGGPNGYWNGTNFTSDSRTKNAQPQIVGFNSLNSAIADPFYTWTDGYKEDPNWSPIVDGLVYRNQFFTQTSIGADINVEIWKGRIPEFIAYGTNLNDTQMRQINTYLAIKYGVTLGQGSGAVYNNASNYDYMATDGTTVVWNATANSTYGYNIAGIGRDDAEGLEQYQSTSVNGGQVLTLTMGLGGIAATNAANAGVFPANKSYLVWGDNNAAATLTSNYNGGTNNRITRRWKVQETGTVGTVRVRIPNTVAGLQTIIVNINNAFSTVDRAYALTNSGGFYEADIDFNNNDFFTFSTDVVPTANLIIGKSGPATATQNVNYDYTLVVTNTGVVASSGQIGVTDTLPAGVSFVSASGFLCTASGQNVTCTSGTVIAPNAVTTITLTVNPTLTGTVSNTANVIGGGDTTSANSNSVSTLVNPPPADLQISKSAPVTGTQNVNFNYTLLVSNTGGSASTGVITVTDALQTGVNFVSGSGSGFTCSASGQNVTCTSSSAIAISGTATITLAVTPTQLGLVNNTASVIGGGDTTSASSNIVSTNVSAAIIPPDLTTTIGQPSPAFVAGQASNVPITVTNPITAGPTTGPITTTMTLPSGTSAPASFNSNGNTCTTSGQIVTCVNPGPINAGSNNTIQVPVTPDNSTIGTSPAFNAGTTTPGDSNTGNNAAAPMTPSSAVAAAASPYDLTTAIGQPSPALVAGQVSTIPVTVTNSGTGPTVGPITTTMTLPSGTTTPASFSSNGNTCTRSGQTVTCVNAGPINAGASNTIQIPVTPDNTTVSTTPQFNAGVTTPSETNTGNNAASPMTPSVPVASGTSPYDLTTTIGQPTPALVAGQPSTVPVTVTNVGTGPTTGPITTTFTLPSGTSAPASFNSNGNTCTTSGQIVTCVNPGPINNASSNTIQVPVTPNASVVGTTPQFNATSATPGETNTGNNGATPMTPASPVVNAADLTTTIGQPSPRLMEGQPSNVPVTVTNNGTGPTTGPITTTFTLPTGTSAPASFSSGGNTCTTSGQTVTCVNPGPINAGSSNTIQVPVTANNGTVGTTPAPFQASAATPGESNTGNNSATPMIPSQNVLSGDVTPPAPPVIVAPSAGISTKDPRPVISGTAEAGAVITVTEGAATLCTTVASGSGNWSCAPTSNLSEGAHTVNVVAQDAAGNISTPPATRSFTVDTTAPAAPTVTAPAASSTVSDTTPTFSGTAEAGSTVSVTEGAATLCTAVANGSGNWSCDATAPLSDGLHTALVTATDPAGNTSPPTTRTFTEDATAPAAPTINAPPANATISNTTPTLAGTAEPNSAVTVKDGPTTVCTTTADGAGNWSCTSSTLAPGAHSLTATATDPAGNTGPASAPRALTVDTTAPLAPTLTAPAANATLGSSTVPVTGSAEPNSAVTVRDGAGGPVVCTTTADAGGNFSCTTSALSNGPHTLAVEATDAAGNTGPAATRPITVSNVGPAITAPAANAIVSTTTPLFTGVGVPGGTVVVKEGATTLCTTLSDGNGNWACAATAPMAQGAHSVTASVTDSGNNTQTSPAVAFTVDTVAPAAPVVTAPANNSSTNDSTPTVAGTAEAGSTVRVTDNGNPVCTAVADGSGNWSCDATAPLSEGPHTLSVTATDPAGNTSTPTTRPFSVDTVAPAAPTVTTPTLNSLLNSATPTVAGQAEPNATVVVKDGPGGPTVCTTTASNTGAYSCALSTPLSQGPHTLSANAVDAAGNAGPNVTVPVTVDSVAPNAPAITQPTNGAVLPGQSPTIAGTAEPGAAITVKDGPTTICTTTASAGGAWSCQPSTPLSNGAHALTATATDTAGNTSPASTPVGITINTSGNNDDDGDGIPNIIECPNLSNCPDADGDGLADYLDPDSDNDGVLDQVEGLNDTDGDGVPNRLENNRADTDGDGITNQLDADDDGDGIPTSQEDLNHDGNFLNDDADGDGIPAYLDPNDAQQLANGGDSDGDGISDSVECPVGLSGRPCPDTDRDGVPDYRDTDSDGDGKLDAVEGTADADGDGIPNRLESRKADTDGDGIPNQNDIDDDGDGILTAAEDLNSDGNWQNDDADKDGIPAYLDPNDAQQLPNGGDGDNDGISDKQECPLGLVGGRCPDTDGDGVPDYLDPDSDNDGIADRAEGTIDSDGDGLPNRLESNRADTDGDGITNQLDPDDDGDGIPTAQEDLNTDGNPLNDDADGDGIPAYLDKNDPSPVRPNGGDSDGDGISDKAECPGGLTGSPCPDSDGDGVPDYRDADSDNDGTPDAQEGTADSDGDGIPNRLESSKADTDNDGVPNQQDADDDGDGIPTAQEDLNTDGNPLNDDADKDGIPAYLDPNDHQPGAGDADNDGISDKTECVVGPVCADTDGDGRPDYMDPDSDGDGVLDAAEGIADGDGDGLPDRLESNRADTNGDGILNPADTDDDGDGIPTKQEDLNGDGNWQNDDADKDGIPAYLDPNDAQKLANGGDSDGDGIPDKTECNGAGSNRCVDTDGDGRPDYMDVDSDGDGTSDAAEGSTDTDGDGIPNRLESSKADTDGDGRPNQQDADDDGDNIPTAQEDLNGDGNPLNDDADKDGIPAYLDSNDNQPNQVDGGDADNDGISDKAECTSGPTCPDTDGDGQPDYRDTDSDGDGTTDLREGTADADGDGLPNRLEPNNVDTDSDGKPNNKDDDDDGDGVPTALEDLNGDGNWMDDDPNGNGVPAYLDKSEPAMTPTVAPKTGVPPQGGTAPVDGTAPAGSPVTVNEGSRVLCTTTANALGQWTCNAPLTLGPHLLTASVTDGSGTTRTSPPAFVMVGRAVYTPIVIKR